MRTMTKEEGEINMQTLPNAEDWIEVMEKKWKERREENLTIILESLRNQERIIGDMKEENHNYRWKEILVAVGATCGGAALLTLIIVLVRLKSCARQTANTAVYEDPPKEEEEKSEYETMQKSQREEKDADVDSSSMDSLQNLERAEPTGSTRRRRTPKMRFSELLEANRQEELRTLEEVGSTNDAE